MAKAKIPVSVNGIEFDALISEERTLEATVPEYAVETGFTVSDSIILSPERLNMVLYVTDTPVTWASRHGSGFGRTEKVIKELEQLYFKKAPVRIVTSSKVYTNMAIESLSFSKTVEVGYAREIPISFKKVNFTTSVTTTIPENYGKSGPTGESAGSANTSAESTDGDKAGEGSKSSILYNIAKSIKNFFSGGK